MKRILAIVALVIVLVAVVFAAFLVTGGRRFSTVSDNEQLITSFLLASVELIGLVVAIALVIFVLYQYTLFRRPYRLVFEAFSNESKLVTAENKPLNLSILAQEELTRQFKLIYRGLKKFIDKDGQEIEALVADELYIEEDASGSDTGKYIFADLIKQSGMIGDLKEVINDLQDPEGINLMQLVGEFVPKEVSPIMKFIETIFPPHVIRATGHLQAKSDTSRRAGITFEFVDLGSQRNLLVRTLRWRSSEHKVEPVDSVPSAHSNTSNETSTNEESDHYIELLIPAMCWVALMFLEQKLISHVPFMNHILKANEKRRKARIYYLIGALYYIHSIRLETYSDFYRQLAVEHLRLAQITDASWSLPYLYLANLYTSKALEKSDELHAKLFKEALNLYQQGLDHTTKTGQKLTHARIIVAKALAELRAAIKSDNDTDYDWYLNQAIEEIEFLKTYLEPADFDAAREEFAVYFYNLASWYQIVYSSATPIPNDKARDEAGRYMLYCLACSQNFWDTVEKDVNFQSMRDAGVLKKIKQELDKKLKEEPKLAKLTGEPFKTEVGRLLKNVDQLSQPVDTQTA